MKSFSAAVLASLLVLVLGGSAAGADPAIIDAEYSLTTTESDNVTHDGELPMGVNLLYFDQSPVGGVPIGGNESCSKGPSDYCEHILLTLTNPVEDLDPDVVEFDSHTLIVTLTTDAADYDLFVYESDADGEVGPELGRSTAFPLGDTSESVAPRLTTSDENPVTYALIRVVYFAPTTPHTLDIRW